MNVWGCCRNGGCLFCRGEGGFCPGANVLPSCIISQFWKFHHWDTQQEISSKSTTVSLSLVNITVFGVNNNDPDITKKTRSLYARANMIIGKFSSASLNTKLMLFRVYCTPIYGCQLWCSMYQYSYNKLRVAYNDAFRIYRTHGAVRPNYLFLMMSHHFMQICGNWPTRYGVRYKLVKTLLSTLRWHRTCSLFHQF